MNAETKPGAWPMQAPYPYFGGKRRVAGIVWRALGHDVPNYIEPFAGSAAVLLARPGGAGRVETINDKCAFVSNFWRAVRAAPEEVAGHAGWIVSERDLEARHYWLITEGRARLERGLGDPEWCCPQVAGWWAWGASCWIGSAFCTGDGPWTWSAGAGWTKRTGSGGVRRKLPHLGNAGGRGLVQLLSRTGDSRQQHEHPHDAALVEWMQALAHRLRRVRVASGDWTRVLGNTVLGVASPCGVFLDPPYGAADRVDVYAQDDRRVAGDVRAWCLENGAREGLRIVLAGYVGEGHEALEDAGWRRHHWHNPGGYGRQGKATTRGRDNARREALWLSPACLDIGDAADAA